MSRSIERRILGLEPTEVAVIEVLRAGPASIEAPWTDFAETISRLECDGMIRPCAITEQLRHEHHTAARRHWGELQWRMQPPRTVAS